MGGPWDTVGWMQIRDSIAWIYINGEELLSIKGINIKNLKPKGIKVAHPNFLPEALHMVIVGKIYLDDIIKKSLIDKLNDTIKRIILFRLQRAAKRTIRRFESKVMDKKPNLKRKSLFF